MFQVGQKVINTNPNSEFYDSIGIVTEVTNTTITVHISVSSPVDELKVVADKCNFTPYPNRRRSLC